METYVLTGGKVITPFEEINEGAVIISDSRIKAIGNKTDFELLEGVKRIDVSGLLILPGFIDLHIHGAVGVRAAYGIEATREVCCYLPSTGTTSWLPTVMDINSIQPVAEAAKAEFHGAEILGIHLEGPYLAPKNLPGDIHEEPRLPCLKEYEGMLEAGQGYIRLMGLAPELKGALDLIREMGRTGVTAAAAHSKATYEELMAAVEAGLSHVTHTYNVMTGFHHRKPGVVGAVLTCDALTAELIGDGFHVSPAAMEILLRCKGIEKIALISDNVQYAGLPDGIYETVEKKNGVVRKRGFTEEVDGSLAGSVWPFDHNFRTVMKHTRRNLQQMAMMSSTVPAKVAGVIDRKGTIEPGKDADIVALRSDGTVAFTLVRGKTVYNNGWKL